ncbi:MAG: hypothetical protein HOK57_12525 [Planctomycetaceae bacterium]|nr:hypothetical protein [Planctomycetaceae bacterium]
MPSRLCISVFVLFFFFMSGCRRPYPQLPPEQLKLIQGIRTAANTKNKERLDAVGEAIRQDMVAGKVSPDLEEILTSLLEECHRGNYNEAEKKCVLLLKDQLRQ